MTWVVRRPPAPEHEHVCAVPMRRVTYPVPAAWVPPGRRVEHVALDVDGALGDVWRCDGCGSLWTVDYRWSPWRYRPVGLRWIPAGPWQRFRHRTRGRRP